MQMQVPPGFIFKPYFGCESIKYDFPIENYDLGLDFNLEHLND